MESYKNSKGRCNIYNIIYVNKYYTFSDIFENKTNSAIGFFYGFL